MQEPPHPPLAVGKVRYVGDQVAVIIAETKAQRVFRLRLGVRV